jgi:hypothetical protein
VVDDCVAITPAAAWALAQLRGRGGHDRVERPPGRFEQPSKPARLNCVERLLIPGAPRVGCAEIGGGAARDPPDDMQVAGRKVGAGDSGVAVGVGEQGIERALLALAAPTPAGPVDRTGEHPGAANLEIDAGRSGHAGMVAESLA